MNTYTNMKTQAIISSSLLEDFLKRDLERVKEVVFKDIFKGAEQKLRDHLQSVIHNISFKVNEDGDLIIIVKQGKDIL
jgi:hypothetical protein